jgi:hypothetical protein
MAKKRPTRTRILVYPRFQLKLIAFNSFIMLLVFGFVWAQANRSFDSLRQMGTEAGLQPGHPYFEFLAFQSNHMFSYLTGAFLTGLVVSSVGFLLMSHRLAGPIVRLRGYFASIAGGVMPERPLSFRRGDFFSDLPEVVNSALGKVEMKHERKQESA